MKVKFKVRIFSSDYITDFIITPEDDGRMIGNEILQLEDIEVDDGKEEIKQLIDEMIEEYNYSPTKVNVLIKLKSKIGV